VAGTRSNAFLPGVSIVSQRPCARIRGVRVLVAPDKFAGSLTAVEAAAALARGWRRAAPGALVDEAALSDGGPGFVDVVHAALGGRLVAVVVRGPLGVRVTATVLVHDAAGGRTAYVESAQACGLALVEPSPLTATDAGTSGVGELLMAALRQDVERVVVGVGGTASTDGGRGCVELLAADGWPEAVELLVATDVTAPLLGPTGAARVFAAQKGADPETVDALEERLRRWAVTSATAGVDAETPGAGAGGGLGYGLLVLGGRVVAGADTVIDAMGLRVRVAAADVVVTGEGQLDASSLLGKAPTRVAAVARDAGRPCLLLAGDSRLSPADLAGTGIVAVHTLVEAYGRAEALAHPADRLADLAERVARGLAERVRPS
jgi:glycerate 2-kinase